MKRNDKEVKYSELPERIKQQYRDANKRYLAKHPERNLKRAPQKNTYMRDRWRANMAWLRGIKAAAGCATCPERDPRCLDFHHKDPSTKAFTIGQSGSQDRATLQKEIDKCVVLCANCHRKLEIGNA